MRQIRPTTSCGRDGGERAILRGHLGCSCDGGNRDDETGALPLADMFASPVTSSFQISPEFRKSKHPQHPERTAFENMPEASSNRLTLEAGKDVRNPPKAEPQLRSDGENGLRNFFSRVDFPASQRSSRANASASKVKNCVLKTSTQSENHNRERSPP